METAKAKKPPKEFDAQAEVARLKAQTKAIRRRSYSQRKSKLDNYHGEIIQLYRNGARAAEIHRWLESLNVNISPSTLSRWLGRNCPNG
jgi:hypothetical protein